MGNCIKTGNKMVSLDSLQARYVASMVLSGVGDSLGYYNGKYEFSFSAVSIHSDLKRLGGLDKICVRPPNWRVSDDTVLHLATAEALVESSATGDKEVLYGKIAQKYVEGMNDMVDRAPGNTTMAACCKLKPDQPKGYQIPFSARAGGCGAAMRSMCIGLRYPREEDLDDLIAVSIESGRMTHHNPTGFLGSLASALFTAYAVQGKPLKTWGHDLILVLEKAKTYIKERDYCADKNLEAWSYFEDKWNAYLKARGIEDGQSEPVKEDNEGKSEDEVLELRDQFYETWAFANWAGSSGHDAPMIAYDALLYSGSSWTELCNRGMFHGGDSDSTGVIAAACWGVMYGLEGVPSANHKSIEYRDRLENAAISLYKLAYPKDL